VVRRCTIEVDVRSPTEDALRRSRRRSSGSRATHGARRRVDAPQAPVTARWKTGSSARLAALAVEVAGDLGFELRDASTGGASDANTTSAAGVPTLDGLGPVGGDDLAPKEWIDLTSVVPRISLLAGLVSRLDSL
jgi:glutamate carboxypeptidase